jgi:hypothetical protein
MSLYANVYKPCTATICMPQLQAKLLMWTDFKQPLLDDLEKCSDTSAIKSALSKALPTDAPDASDQQRSDVILDMLAHTYHQVRVALSESTASKPLCVRHPAPEPALP